ncbi:hypothetical protein [Serratia odorifera]|uniref:hypothetical protein n=1 Tax=Serratia odorifera TaxID=618 RepID=UPI001F5441BE|nr:hypothetical protein [Serratia odorifera]
MMGQHSVLLTGDLEAKGEAALLRQRANLPATLLQVPHHGSKTSSNAVFFTGGGTESGVGFGFPL